MPTKLIGTALFTLGLIYLFFFLIPTGLYTNIKHLFNAAALLISGSGLFFYKKK